SDHGVDHAGVQEEVGIRAIPLVVAETAAIPTKDRSGSRARNQIDFRDPLRQ
ncbi:hypothetical protein Dimus_001381, partial [Dionaea muscipula]